MLLLVTGLCSFPEFPSNWQFVFLSISFGDCKSYKPQAFKIIKKLSDKPLSSQQKCQIDF